MYKKFRLSALVVACSLITACDSDDNLIEPPAAAPIELPEVLEPVEESEEEIVEESEEQETDETASEEQEQQEPVEDDTETVEDSEPQTPIEEVEVPVVPEPVVIVSTVPADGDVNVMPFSTIEVNLSGVISEAELGEMDIDIYRSDARTTETAERFVNLPKQVSLSSEGDKILIATPSLYSSLNSFKNSYFRYKLFVNGQIITSFKTTRNVRTKYTVESDADVHKYYDYTYDDDYLVTTNFYSTPGEDGVWLTDDDAPSQTITQTAYENGLLKSVITNIREEDGNDKVRFLREHAYDDFSRLSLITYYFFDDNGERLKSNEDVYSYPEHYVFRYNGRSFYDNKITSRAMNLEKYNDDGNLVFRLSYQFNSVSKDADGFETFKWSSKLNEYIYNDNKQLIELREYDTEDREIGLGDVQGNMNAESSAFLIELERAKILRIFSYQYDGLNLVGYQLHEAHPDHRDDRQWDVATSRLTVEYNTLNQVEAKRVFDENNEQTILNIFEYDENGSRTRVSHINSNGYTTTVDYTTLD